MLSVNTAQNTGKWKTILLHSTFAVMLFMAYYFFKERLYADSAYYIFHSIDSGFFVTANQRIVLAISEILSLAVFYLGAPLKTILITWSLSHVLFYYLLFVIVYHVKKNESAGVAIILLQVIGQVWLYYSPMLEICYGAALLVVFYVLYEEKKLTRGWWIWIIILEILVLSSHPENFVLFFFIVVSDILKNGFLKKIHFPLFIILVITIILKSVSFSEYEGGKLNYMLDVDQNRLYKNLLDKNYMADVWAIFKNHYPVLLIFLVIVTSALILRKNFRQLGLLYFTVCGLIVLINATNFAKDFSRYNESLYYPVAGVITIAFLRDFYDALGIKWKSVLFMLLILTSFFQLNGIRKNGEYLKLRTRQMENIILETRTKGVSKSLVRLENTEKDRWVFNWSYPMESLLLSSLDGPSGTVSLVADEDYDFRDTSVALTSNHFILRRWEIREDENMLPYYKVNPCSYLRLNHADSTVDESLFMNKILLEATADKPFEDGSRIFIPVRIVNQSGITIPSLPIDHNYFEINYEGGNRFSESRIPFDINISKEYTEVLSYNPGTSERPMRLVIKMVIGKKEAASAIADIR